MSTTELAPSAERAGASGGETRTTVPAWDVLARRLVAHGVEDAFGVPGDDMVQLVALRAAGITVHGAVDQRHAVYQALAYARVGHRLGVCFTGRGPAVTHAATGVLEARAGRVPCLLVTTGVAEEQLGTGAFQELDAVSTLAPLAKAAWRVRPGGDVVAAVDAAVALASTGAPGPVCLEVPEGAHVTTNAPLDGAVSAGDGPGPAPVVGGVAPRGRLDAAERPVLVVGGGCVTAGVGPLVEELARRSGAAVVCTASGRGAVREDHTAFLGLSGLYATPSADVGPSDADLVVVLGSQLEETATFGWVQPWPEVLHVNAEPSDAVRPGPDVPPAADLARTLTAWLAEPWPAPSTAREAWSGRVRAAAATARRRPEPQPPIGGLPRVAAVLSVLDDVLPDRRVSLHENGLQDMWSYFSPWWPVRAGADCLVPSEQTPLGLAFGAARGAARSAGDRPVVVIGGDGAWVAAASEVGDLARLRHPVLLVVLVNGGFGWLESNARASRRQELSGWSFLSPARPVGGICAAHGLAHVRCDRAVDLEERVGEAWRRCAAGRPVVLEVEVALGDVPPGLEDLAGAFPQEPEGGLP